jgi:hypothetical protein
MGYGVGKKGEGKIVWKGVGKKEVAETRVGRGG